MFFDTGLSSVGKSSSYLPSSISESFRSSSKSGMSMYLCYAIELNSEVKLV